MSMTLCVSCAARCPLHDPLLNLSLLCLSVVVCVVMCVSVCTRGMYQHHLGYARFRSTFGVNCSAA